MAPPPADFPAGGVRRSLIYRRVADFLAGWLAASGGGSRPRVIAACSGGPDSTALLLALWALREELAIQVHVVCVDHQLRPEASAEAALVVQVAGRLGLRAECIAVSCPPGPSQMATARTARYDALALAARRLGAAAVLVAHTQPDQTETMLMRWLAGAGLLGLCGMEAHRDLPVPGDPTHPVTLLRPLLTTSRGEIEAFLAATPTLVAPLPLHDPSNVDRHYQRSRLRHDLLPLLRGEQPQLDERLTQLAVQLREDSDYLEQQAEAAYQALRRPRSATAELGIFLPLAATAALPPALFARVVMRASGGGLGQTHITAVRGLCAHPRGTQALDLPGGRRVERRYTQLHFFTPGALPGAAANPPTEQLLPACGHYALWQGTLDLQWEPQPAPAAKAASPAPPLDSPGPSAAARPGSGFAGNLVLLPLPPSAFPLTLRAPRPGDRIRLSGNRGHRKVSDLLIDLKVPRSTRAAVLLLCWGPQILWVVGHRVAAPPPDLPTEPWQVLRAHFVSTQGAP